MSLAYAELDVETLGGPFEPWYNCTVMRRKPIVIDTSVVIAVVTGEGHRAALIRATRGLELLAPASLPAEVGNAFSAMCRRGRISLAEATAAVAAFEKIPLRLIALELETALSLAHDLAIYAYDAYAIGCALAQGAPLLTLDDGQRAAAVRAGSTVVELTS